MESQHDAYGDVDPKRSHHFGQLPNVVEMTRFWEREKALNEVLMKKRPAAANRAVMKKPSASKRAVMKKPSASKRVVQKRPSQRM